MELSYFVALYDFGKPMRAKVYRRKPFRVDFEGYVVDNKLIDDYGNITCADVRALDDEYSVFNFGIEGGELVVLVSPKATV